MKSVPLAGYRATHFDYAVNGKVATITLDRPERKNPLTFDSYGELRDLFREMVYASDIKAVVFTGEGGNFCSGGDVHEIIGPLVKMDMPELLEFTRMTGDLVKAMRACPQPIIAAIDGVCTGAGAMIACGVRPAHRHRAQQARVPVRARRPRRRRHGRVHAAAAADRPVARGGPALHRPRRRRRGGRTLRLLQPPGRARRAAAPPDALAKRARRWPDLRPRDDQDDALAGMELGPGRMHRGRGAGAGDLHADEATSSARITPSRRSRSRSSRATERRSGRIAPCLIELPRLAVLRRRPPALRRRARSAGGRRAAAAARHDEDDLDSGLRLRAAIWCASSVRAGLLRVCVPGAYGGGCAHEASTCAASRLRARRSARVGARGLRARDAGPRQRAGHVCSATTRRSAALLPGVAARRVDRRVRALRARGRVRRRAR